MAADVDAIVPPLLRALTVLEFIARHLDPLTFDRMFAAIGTPDAPLRAVLEGFGSDAAHRAGGVRAGCADRFDGIRDALATATICSRSTPRWHSARAEALYARAADVSAVNAFFSTSLRAIPKPLARAGQPRADGATGVMRSTTGKAAATVRGFRFFVQ